MPVTSTTLAGVNVWQFSGAVTDAEIKTAWASTISNGVYVLNRAIYLDETADISAVSGGMLVDFGTQVLPAIILHDSGDRTKQVFNNFTFLQRTGLTVANRSLFIRGTNGTVLTAINDNGLSQKGGGFVYGVFGVAPGGGDNRYLNELPFGSLEGVTIYSQEFTEQELQVIAFKSTQLKGLTFEKAYGFPQLGTATGNVNVTVYRSNQNTQATASNGLIPIRLFPYSNRYAAACYVDSYVTRNSADITVNLIATFGSNASNLVNITILNNFERGSWFGTSKTSFTASNWFAGNTIHGGVLKKLQFVNGDGGIVKCYDSRSTTAPQKSSFQEIGFIDFLETTTTPATDAEGKISLVHIGAIATGGSSASIPITRYNNQRYTFQKFGYRVLVATPDMTSGDNDLSAFAPIILTEQAGISRTQSAITAATTITNFQELLEELHVLAISLSGEQSYNGYNNGNLFDFTGGELKTNFTTVIVNPNASSKISYNAATNTLTIKASNLVGNETVNSWNNSIGTFIFQNGAVIQGVYVSSVGPSTVLQLNTPSDGYSLCLYNIDGVSKYFASGLNAGSYYVYFAPNEAGIYTFAAEKYGEKRTEDTLVLNGGNVWYNITDGEDVGITDSFATASALTTVSTTSQMYDVTAIFRLTEVGIKLGQLVARDGLYLDFADKNVKLKDDASAIIAVVGDTITYKSIVINATPKYNAMKATPPQTITPTDTEIINVLVEDANGDSKLSILGGDDAGYELWKVPTATATDNYATGTLLTTLSSNDDIFRFIGISGFDIVGRDISSGVRRRSSMLKGTYNQAFYVGNQIQLSTDAPQLIENNQKLDELLLKVDTKLDVAVSTRLADADYVEPATPQNVLDAKTEVLEAIGDIPNTDISGLALEVTAQSIKTTVDALENYDDQVLIGKVDAIQTSVDNIDVDFTPVLDAVATKPTLSQIEAGKVGDIKTKVDTLNNYNDATVQTKLDGIKAKTDVLENADLTGIATATDVQNAKDSIETKIDNIVVDNDAIAAEVWSQEPDRLKQVATVETTGDQLAAFNNA